MCAQPEMMPTITGSDDEGEGTKPEPKRKLDSADADDDGEPPKKKAKVDVEVVPSSQGSEDNDDKDDEPPLTQADPAATDAAVEVRYTASVNVHRLLLQEPTAPSAAPP